jgi:hypothetical protein
MIKCFQYESSQLQSYIKNCTAEIEITAINFGPYDNGHVIIGLNIGAIFVLNSYDLSSMFRFQVFDPFEKLSVINNIKFDPT